MPSPPPHLDDLDLNALRARLSEKWNTYPDDVLPAWVAEMDFPLAEPIRELLQRSADLSDVGYPISRRATGLPEAFAERMQSRFGWAADARRVEIISDVVQGLYVGVEAYAVERRGVVVQTPIYPPFLRAVEDTGRRLIENRLSDRDVGRLEFDLDQLRADIDDDAAVVALCNPHNPSGRVYTRDELEQLAEIVLERDLVVLSDEIHADLVYSGGHHIPFASLGPEVAQRTVTLTSATKAFNIAGLRCAIAHFGSPDLQRRYRAAHPRHVCGGIGILGIYATLAAWQHGDAWLDAVRGYLEGNRDFLRQAFDDRFPGIVYHEPEATYLAWLDCRSLGLEPTPGAHFMRHGKVALSHGHAFGKGYEGFARINFATSRAILEQVLERMQTALAVG